MRNWLVGVGLALVTSGLLAAPQGAVVRVQGEVVTINRGEQDKVKRGDRWMVYHDGKAVAELQVEQVGEYSSLARITQKLGAAPAAGDLVSSGSPTDAPVVITPARGGPPDDETAPPRIASANPPITSPGLATAPRSQNLQELEERYKEMFESRTQSKDFRQTAGSPRSHNDNYPGMDLMNLYSNLDLLFSSFGPGGTFYGDPATLILTAGSNIAGSQARDRLYEAVDSQFQIQVTYWDEKLMDAYADYVAVTEGKGSPDKMVQIKNSLFQQKGVNRNRVFEVRMRNIGRVQGQLSPFHWHIFMAGPGGSHIKPERYDNVLDRSLNPGQEVTGNVYFPNAEFEGGMTILLEDIFGDRAQFEFSSKS